MPHSVKDHTTGIASILGIKKNTFLTQEVVFIGENYSAKMAVSSVVKTNFFKGEVDFSLWRRELETTREKIIPPAMRCIKKDRVVGALWIKKLISRSYSVNLTLFLLKVRLIYISPFLRALLSRKKKTKNRS